MERLSLIPALAIVSSACSRPKFETTRTDLEKPLPSGERPRLCMRINLCNCWVGCGWAERFGGEADRLPNPRFKVVSGPHAGSLGLAHRYAPPGYVSYPFEWVTLDRDACPFKCPDFIGHPLEPAYTCHSEGNECKLREGS